MLAPKMETNVVSPGEKAFVAPIDSAESRSKAGNLQKVGLRSNARRWSASSKMNQTSLGWFPCTGSKGCNAGSAECCATCCNPRPRRAILKSVKIARGERTPTITAAARATR